MPLFSVRSFIQLAPRPQVLGKHLYEERVTLWRATDANEAIRRAEAETREYAIEEIGVLPLFQAFELYDEVTFDGNSAEVFSLIRASELSPKQYLGTFFDTGMERQKNVDA
jgi:hypothetical protein